MWSQKTCWIKAKILWCLKSSVLQPDAWCQRHWICSELSLLFHTKHNTCYTGSVLLQVSRDGINCCSCYHCKSKGMARTPRNLKYELLGDWANTSVALLLHLSMFFFFFFLWRILGMGSWVGLEYWRAEKRYEAVEWSPRGVEGCRILCHLGTEFFISACLTWGQSNML